jgi:gliding motility-associated-like protein
MKRWGLVLMLLIYFPLTYNANAQNISNEGTDFWAVFPTHDPSTTPGNQPREANITIWITSKFQSQVTVTCNGNVVGTANTVIRANEPQAFNVPRNSAYIKFDEQNLLLSNRGIHVQVAPGNPKVAVYAHIFAGARSAASLILPYESLGQRYFSMNYTQDLDNSRANRNFLTIVASDDNTDVIIHPASRSALRVHLNNAGDVYEYMPQGTEDLTGTYVEIDPLSPDNCTKRFAVFSGSTSVTIGCATSRDPLYQQLYPVTSWGKTYCIVPFKDRKYYFRVLAEEDNTLLRIGNSDPILINKGVPYTSPIALTQALLVSANKKISVAQYSLTQDCSGATGSALGDPEMVLLNPIEFNIKSITLFSSNLQDIREKYINVSMKTSATGTFKINGQLPSGTWALVPDHPELSYIQIRTFEQGSTLTANEGFNAIAYGFGDHESYAYSAGTNLAANTYLLISNSVTEFDSPNACKDQESNFKIVLPYKALKITWQLDEEPEYIGSLVSREFVGAGGDLLYEYTYEKKQVFSTIEKHNMVVRAEKPNTSDCLGSTLEYTFTFDVYPIPNAAFSIPEDACFGSEVLFNDLSISHLEGRPIDRWLWDFGDGRTSTEQNPKHVYQTSGVFTVHLSAGLEAGCMSDVIPSQIVIKPKISPNFEFKTVECLSSEVVFSDRSTVENNAAIITSWLWDFGDGTEPESIKSPRHLYTAAGKYPVRLVVGTNDGCKSDVKELLIEIKGMPISKFSMPEICSEDGKAVFTNLSTDADGSTTTGLKYLWQFGDGGVENVSTEQNGSHRYSAAGDYLVTLSVTTINGCETISSQLFTVNGSEITAKFDVINKTALCSSNVVKVKNAYVLNSGKLAKIIWIKDKNNSEDVFVDEDPEPGKTYDFVYPEPVSLIPRKFTIVMQAYSGIGCVAEYYEEITIYPSPKVIFDPLPSVCVNAGKFLLKQGRETLGLDGTPSYSGPGVTPDGVFDPEVAGVGTHILKFTFATSRCEDVKTSAITVYPIPRISVTRDVFIYAGENKQLALQATGLGLVYKWVPSINLDKDNVQNPTVTADIERTYTVTVASSDGCSVAEKVSVHIIPEIANSNAFSPNGDGINDTWIINNIEIYLNASVEIFNRYGVRVYFSKGFYKPFDGNYKDIPLPVGTYYYIINPNNGRKIVTGSLTLIR